MNGDDDADRPRPPAPPPAPERPAPSEEHAPPERPPVQIAAPSDWPKPGDAIADRPFPELRPAAPPLPPPARPPAPPKPPLRRPARRRKPIVRRAAVLLLQLVLAFVLGSVLWVAAYRFLAPPITFTMAGDVFAGRGLAKSWRPLAAIDRDMARAVIAAEDARFCTHSGFDVAAIVAAAERNAEGGRIRGGSTISQQTAKNAFLWQGGGYFRKALEAWFTLLIETIWGKRRILEVYLNIAETGIGTYGVEAGARRYFGHGADRLSPREAAQIAAVLPLPKKRAGTAPAGFTRRYANRIQRDIAAVRAQRLDACAF